MAIQMAASSKSFTYHGGQIQCLDRFVDVLHLIANVRECISETYLPLTVVPLKRYHTDTKDRQIVATSAS